MLKALALTLVLASGLALASTAKAGECPVEFGNADYMDTVIDKIEKSPSCYEGAELARDCALGAGGDYAIARTAETKCSADFDKKLTIADKRTYNSLMAKCAKKYAKMEGTMYVSMAAHCRLNVAALYSNLFTPAE